MGRPLPDFRITSKQRGELDALTRKRTIDSKLFLRARLILLVADGHGHTEIGLMLGIHRNHVAKWRKRFDAQGVDGLADIARSGKPRSYTDSDRHRIVTRVCTTPPKGRSRWSVRSLAKDLKISETFVHRVLKAHDLHPHRLRTFNFSPDPQFEDKLLDVVGLYMSPPDNALVLCMDEKTGIQALDRTQPVLPLRSKNPKSWSNEYVRHGTQTMLAAVNIQTGRATTWVNKTRKAADFVKFMDQLVREYPGQRLYVVMDNLNTHKGKLATTWLEQHPLVSFHFTPTHASWVNLAECFFSILTRQGLKQAVHRSVKELRTFLRDFVKQYNKNCGPFVWTKGPKKLERIIELTKSYQSSQSN
jgi:transposase